MKKLFQPLVVGAPRSGFTLLISVVSHLKANRGISVTPEQKILNLFIDAFDYNISSKINAVFEEAGLKDKVIFNGNFQRLGGGPKWIKPDQPDYACFRKYIGVNGLGDFTILTSHPKETLNYDGIIHSHVNPRVWLEDPAYAEFTKFASIRNPIGIINSSIFSINALTSEYIQRFVPKDQDNDELRQLLSLYKMTDLDFFEGLVTFLKSYLEDYVKWRPRYIEMKWEDLILEPEKTIVSVGTRAGLDVTAKEAGEIWGKIDHRNLTGFHKHNFRVGKGKVGDWKNWLVNEHLEIMRKHDFEPLLKELGYDPIPTFSPSEYNAYQQKVQGYIAQGKVFEDYPDQDLFGYSFNKSNINTEKFPFRRPGWKKSTAIERSGFKDEALENKVWAVAEKAVGEMNLILTELIRLAAVDSKTAIQKLEKFVAERFPEKVGETKDGFVRIKGVLSGKPNSQVSSISQFYLEPKLIFEKNAINYVGFKDKYYAIPHSVGAVDLSSGEDLPSGVRVGASLQEVQTHSAKPILRRIIGRVIRSISP